MSYLDVKKYYLDVHQQYVEMTNYMEDFEKRFKNGEISEEQAEDIRDNYEVLKANYDRLSYIMYLFELPKSTKHKQTSVLLKDKMYVLAHAGKEVVVDENTDVLKAFESFQRHLKEKENREKWVR